MDAEFVNRVKCASSDGLDFTYNWLRSGVSTLRSEERAARLAIVEGEILERSRKCKASFTAAGEAVGL